MSGNQLTVEALNSQRRQAVQLRLEGHTVSVAENGRQAVDQIRDHRFDLVITDLIMPEKEGLETIADIRKHHRLMPIIAISGGGRVGRAESWVRAR